MSRSGYIDEDWDNTFGLWRGTVASSIRGKRGQALLRDAIIALDAMTEKKLARGFLERDGCHCLLGVVCKARGVDMRSLNVLDPDDFNAHGVAHALDISTPMAKEIVELNDQTEYWQEDLNPHPDYGRVGGYLPETPEHRWQRMRDWCVKNLKESQA